MQPNRSDHQWLIRPNWIKTNRIAPNRISPTRSIIMSSAMIALFTLALGRWLIANGETAVVDPGRPGERNSQLHLELPVKWRSIFAFSSGGLMAEQGQHVIHKKSGFIYKVLCYNSPEGCACSEKPDGSGVVVDNIRFGEAITLGRSIPETGRVKLLRHQQSCFFPVKNLQHSEASDVVVTHFKSLDHSLLPLAKLVTSGQPSDPQQLLAQSQRIALGRFYPTYYHLAMEDFHPGKLVDVRDASGKKVGRASEQFLEQVKWEGSGVGSDGTHYHTLGKNRFETYSAEIWGYGAGLDYTVSPYRTMAVNFKGICKALGWGGDCGKRQILGLMVYIPEVARRNIVMADGSIHDGFFCMTDTGAPYYIRADRIDLFVGTHGGGNPYLPPERQGNLLIKGGIKNVVPADWALWDEQKGRFWCEVDQLPQDPMNPQPGDCLLDYHYLAREKALHMEALMRNGEPVRCNRRIKRWVAKE